MNLFRKYPKATLTLLCLLVSMSSFVIISNRIIEKAAMGKLYTAANQIPHNKAGLLLGTGKFLENGSPNPYYEYRINATVELLKASKIDYLIISGDNSRPDYNEPQMMKEDLGNRGIDTTKIYLDYAGFRTFDSIVRLKEIFNQDSVTIISQPFHNQRALYIAQKEGIAAIGFNAQDVSTKFGFKTQLREKLARTKVFLDYLLGTQPKFLGPKVTIPG